MEVFQKLQLKHDIKSELDDDSFFKAFQGVYSVDRSEFEIVAALGNLARGFIISEMVKKLNIERAHYTLSDHIKYDFFELMLWFCRYWSAVNVTFYPTQDTTHQNHIVNLKNSELLMYMAQHIKNMPVFYFCVLHFLSRFNIGDFEKFFEDYLNTYI